MAIKFSNTDISNLLKEVAAAYEAKGGNPFKIRAYRNAAVSCEHAASYVKDMWEEGGLGELPGIGKNISNYIAEYLETGQVSHFREVKKGLPEGMFELIKIPGIGAKTAFKLSTELKLNNRRTAINELYKAAKGRRIRKIEGFGEKSELELLESLKTRKKSRESRILISEALRIAENILNYLNKSTIILRSDCLGSLRRRVSTVGDIDISVKTKYQKEAIEYFVKYKGIREVLEKGDVKARVLLKSGYQVDFYTQTPRSYGSLLQHLTGSKSHNISLRKYALSKNMSLSENGIKCHNTLQKFEDEESLYKFLGMRYIEPELREDLGEIRASISGKLPKLVKISDIKGDLHTHTAYSSDAVPSIKENVEKAVSLGYEYIGITDHAPSIVSRGRKEVNRIVNTIKRTIEQINDSQDKIRVLFGFEVIIKSDTAISLPDDILSRLDYAIGSIHTSFNQSKKKITERLVKAIENPYIKFIGHPTGRLLATREAYEVDWDKVFEACKENNKFLEVNAYPERLDLPDFLIKDAVENGVKLIINTDSHQIGHFDYMEFGVAMARRGWAEKKNIVNTLPVKEFLREMSIEKRSS